MHQQCVTKRQSLTNRGINVPIQIVMVPDLGGAETVEVIDLGLASGDVVALEDSLLVLESDKAAMDMPSPVAGVFKKYLVTEGAIVHVGDAIAEIDMAKETPADAENPPEEKAIEASSSVVMAKNKPEAVMEKASIPVSTVQRVEMADFELGSGKTIATDIYAGPVARKFARELGVSLIEVIGTGSRGRILKDDINNFVKKVMKDRVSTTEKVSGDIGISPAPIVDFSQFGVIKTIKMSKIQKLTAANMQRNWRSIPHVTQLDEADITELEVFRKSLKVKQEKRVTLVAFLIKAIGSLLQSNPEFNRSLAVDGKHFIQKHYIHIGMAVDTPRGLVVPVIRDVDEKDIWDISVDVAMLANKARDGKLSPAEMKGGCFTLSSLGAIGGNGFTPIINAPEIGILGVSKSQMKSTWDGSVFVPRLMLPLALSYDHRAINGAEAGRFLVHLIKLLGDVDYFSS